MKNTPRFLGAVLLACVLLVVGYKAGVSRVDKTEVPAQSAVAPKDNELQRLRSQVAALTSELEGLKLRSEAKAPEAPAQKAPGLSSADRLRALSEARRLGIAMNIPILDGKGMVSPKLVSLLELTPAEQALLQGAFSRAHQAVEEKAIAGARLAKADRQSVTMTIPAFEGGADIYDEVVNSFAKVLDGEELAAFLSLNGDELTKAFGSFGAETRTITIKRYADHPGGIPFELADERLLAGGKGTYRTMALFMDTSNLPPQYGWMARHLNRTSELDALEPQPMPRAAQSGSGVMTITGTRKGGPASGVAK